MGSSKIREAHHQATRLGGGVVTYPTPRGSAAPQLARAPGPPEPAHLRCPRCRSTSTTWTPSGGLSCDGCGLCTEPPKYASPNYEGETWSFSEQRWIRAAEEAWSEYPPTGRFVRVFGDSEGTRCLGSEGDALEALIAKRGQPLEIQDMQRICAGVSDESGTVMLELLKTLILELWGADQRPKQRVTRRSPFGKIGDVLRFSAGSLGVGSGGWKSYADGPKLAIAVTRKPTAPPFGGRAAIDHSDKEALAAHALEVERRRLGGFRSGAIHASGSSRNGSTGGAPNLTAVELGIDVQRAIEKSGVSPEDLRLLRIKHAEAKPDLYAVVFEVLVSERVLRGDEPKAVADIVIAEHRKPVAERMHAAELRLEHAFRALARNGMGSDGQPRVPDEVPLLRPGDDDERPRGRRFQAPQAGLDPTPSIGLAR